KNAGTSGTQEDVVEDYVPTTPMDNTVSNDPQEKNNIAAEGNTHPDESEGPRSKDVEETSSDDKSIENNTVIVNVENYVSKSPAK
ncbi:hypothetical protein A2U01_0087433, partial [Trifolium medium]|nr:hypothetical protein [Trifolium medium]